MNYEQFAIWLHGFLEISNVEEINKEQTQIIKDHLALLFEKKTPDRSKKREKDDLQILEEKYKQFREKNENKPPAYPPYIPPLNPTYPNWQWIPPEPVYCRDDTAPPPPDSGAIISKTNPCGEIGLGKQFVGVDLKFDSELHKGKKYC